MLEVKPLVSVIIPLYNAEKYIEQTIESILKQTYNKIELIIVDDESTDNSSYIVKRIQKNYPNKIKYIYQKNQGVSVARNTGIENANGDYIAFLDSDDLWYPTKIEKQIESMYLNKMDACYCGYNYFYEETSKRIQNFTEFQKGDIAISYLTRKVIAQTSTWIFKKSIVIDYNIRFQPGCNWGEDLEFLFKLISVTNVCYVDEYLTDYRVLSDGNLTSKYKDYNLKTNIELGVCQRIKEWTQINHTNLITTDQKKLDTIIVTHLFPFTIIHSAYTYLTSVNHIEKDVLIQIKSDLKRYCQKIYLRNGVDSLKLYIKLWILRFKTALS
ncbi:glycosyltransferase [Bacillus mobilis]